MDFPIELPPKFLEKATQLKIQPQDIIEQFTRGSGSGGQKVNKSTNTVNLSYPKYNIYIKCQKHRLLSANRLSAYKLLITKVENIVKGKKSEQALKIFKLRKQKKRRSKKAKEKMLEAKHRRSSIKEGRRKIDF